jgi:hypothetical protein
MKFGGQLKPDRGFILVVIAILTRCCDRALSKARDNCNLSFDSKEWDPTPE